MRRGEFEYIPRNPEASVLYQVIAEQLETFLARQQERERPLPGFVEREFRKYLTCGIGEYGVLRLHCDRCGHDRILPYSCKRRAWCPSCCGRRMADTAAYLVDHVIPYVPTRQWVLSLPFKLRYRVAYDSKLMGEILNIFVRTVFGEWRRRAREAFGLKRTQCGAVTFVQRFNSALALNVHFHAVLLDGVVAADAEGQPEFCEMPPPEDREVLQAVTLISERVQNWIERRGLEEEPDRLSENDSGLAELYAAAVRNRITGGPNAGNRVATLGGDRIDGDSLEALSSSRCAAANGFNLHANVAIGALDRQRLERLLRYASRPAIAQERLSRLPDGRLLYRLKRIWSDGTTDVIYEPQDFMAKLAASVPAPRIHLIRFHGVLGPAAKWRPLVVPRTPLPPPSAPESDAMSISTCLDSKPVREMEVPPGLPPFQEFAPRRRNYAWAYLMMRVFKVDVLKCERCGNRLRIVAAIQPPEATERILTCLGLPCRALPLSPARSEPSPEWF